MKKLVFVCFLAFSFFANSQGLPQPLNIYLYNVKIFNGKDNQITTGNILIEGRVIKKISVEPIELDKNAPVGLIDGRGLYVMPGLIDAHVHLMFESIPKLKALTSDYAYVSLFAAKAMEEQLLRGFTSVRDLGGGALVLQKAVNEGLYPGPRIFASGAMISQTGGHADFGLPTDVPRVPGQLSYAERNGIVAIADGADLVLLRSREQLRQGATQLKLMAGGGVSSDYDPLDVTQYTEAEFRAAVSAAENWGTYVTVHAYTPNAIQTAVRAGVKCIEHGQLADEATAKLLAEKDVWWCLQPFLDDEDANPHPEGSANRAKQIEMSAGTDNAYQLAKKHKVKTAFGTDCLFDSALAKRQGKQLAKLSRWYTAYEVLKMATYDNAQLLSMSGKRNPYPAGKLGEISEGAYADLIVVDGNPLENINLIADPANHFKLIMKDGVVYKNTLSE